MQKAENRLERYSSTVDRHHARASPLWRAGARHESSYTFRRTADLRRGLADAHALRMPIALDTSEHAVVVADQLPCQTGRVSPARGTLYGCCRAASQPSRHSARWPDTRTVRDHASPRLIPRTSRPYRRANPANPRTALAIRCNELLQCAARIDKIGARRLRLQLSPLRRGNSAALIRPHRPAAEGARIRYPFVRRP